MCFKELDYQNAFRSMDVDFDGVITKKDLKSFLVNTINLHEYDIQNELLDRLYKQMDIYKRGYCKLSFK